MKEYRTSRRFFCWFSPLIAAALFLGCDSPPPVVEPTEAPEAGKVFASPEDAVEIAGGFIREHQWEELAAYYDLSDSDLSIEELAEGTFFHASRTEGMEHPSGTSRYRHPFPPGYRLLQTEPTDRDDTTKVILSLEIDQGIGVPQRALAAFLLRKQADGSGWKILPQSVEP